MRTTIQGRYVLVPNPRTTEPPLPGMAYAVSVDSECYYLTSAGRWSAQARAWPGFAPAVGDAVTVVGSIHRVTDVRGEEFLTIEVESLTPDER
jgi:hypothetical protein